jgi:CheY-like chemotaxis protein
MGITATNHVRNLTDENKKNIPIIALTQCWRKRTIRMLKCWMNDFVTKPLKLMHY